MKTKKNLYNNILNYDKTLSVYYKIKKNFKNKNKLYYYSLNLNTNLLNILIKLKNNNYKFNKYNIFFINEPKLRLIMSETINDKIVNHLIAKYILLDSLETKLIDTNVATRINKGSKYAFNTFIKYINKLNNNKEIYILKLDIKKYFYNIDHNILFNMIKRYIKDEKSLKIIKEIIDSTNENYINDKIIELKNNKINSIKKLNITNKEKQIKIEEVEKIPLYKKGKGLPIGNLTSQILAIFYLNDIDHYIKEKLKFKYYIRYMDDLLIIDTSKDKLKKSYKLIEKEINNIKLSLNNKSNLYKLSNGIVFLGYKFKLNKNKLEIRYNNKTIRRIEKKLKNLKIYNIEKYNKSLGSYKGYFKLCNTNIKLTF